jgi:glycosyltransferase involved in cell wall biosynthesis
MRILLDCSNLSADPPGGEKSLLVQTLTALLTREKGVEWIVPAPRRIPGSIGRRVWTGWQWPRMVKKYKPDLVMKAEEIAGAAGAADDRYMPLTAEEKESVRRSHAEGKEYFLAGVAGAGPEGIVELLKAFSLFKKRQRSNMQLVIGGAGPARGRMTDITGKLATYKYRSDIHLYERSEEERENEWRKLVAAAYAFLIPFGKDLHGLALFNAWKSETPVIATDAVRLQEVGGDAVLFVRPGDPASLAGGMMSLYTNEGLRSELIVKGRERLGSFSWEASVAQVWEGILRATNKQ